ncbi:hypothetical protein [Acaryochloris sp. IP29b_bin.137]|uniref:tetratricopeptide repeat protein n=1 Tax=Acaryochloris sp. IP29b_bin.137 TaxID=2969217 RepID=UPI00260A6BFC|nr:hypothetical protein [Acaryochloris sp. IP29b_bin.137]
MYRLWNFLSICCLVASLCLFIDISDRLLHGEPDIFGSIILIIQTSITPFIIGGFLTRSGKNSLNEYLKKIGFPVYFRQKGKLSIAASFLFILIFFYMIMPIIGNAYHGFGKISAGYETLTNREIIEPHKALKNYKRAIKYSPDNRTFRYSLAAFYERLNDLELAKKEYKLLAGVGHLQSAINLSRLYLSEGKIENASRILSKALHEKEFQDFYKKNQINEISTDTNYDLQVNLGWTRLLQKNYKTAYEYLDEAITIDTYLAPAHCLLAITKEDTGNYKDSLVEWEKCLALAGRNNRQWEWTVNMRQWYDMAQQRVDPDDIPPQEPK